MLYHHVLHFRLLFPSLQGRVHHWGYGWSKTRWIWISDLEMGQHFLMEYNTDMLDAEVRHHSIIPISFESLISNKSHRNPSSCKLVQINHTIQNQAFTMLQTIVIPLAFAIVTFAAVMPIGYCLRPAIIYTASGPPVLDTYVASCNSTMTATCGLGVRASTSAEYTVIIGC